MTDLASFLLARIAEDEAVARAATPSPWVPDSQGWKDSDDDWIIVAPYHDLDVSDEDAKHVTRWHPARVLAECEAKRRIVEQYVDAVNRGKWATCSALEKVLPVLALPYADHPDYDEAWRP